MKRFVSLALAAAMPFSSFAQSNYSFDEEVNAELDRMYQQSQSPQTTTARRGTPPQVQVNVQAHPQAQSSATQTNYQAAQQTAPVVQSAPQMNAPVAAPAVQTQPTTIVEASPLQESRAENLRRNRQDAEVQTEQKIVEKLEESRLEDEKRRSDVLFGDKFNQLQSGVTVQNSPNAVVNTNQQVTQQEQAVVPVVVPEKVVTAPPAPPKEEIDREIIRSEVRASLETMKGKEKEEEKKPEDKAYFSGLVGMGDYPDVKNVRGNYSLGFAVGRKIRNNLLVEGSFLYSQYEVEQRDGGIVCDYYTCTEYPRITEMNQYQGGALVKYQIGGGMFRPVFGGVAAYTYRTFTDTQFAIPNNDASSHAFDMGLVTGADVEVSDSFTIGLDIRYMWNLFSRTSNSGFQKSFSQSVYGSDTAVEKLHYMNFGIVGRASF